MSKKILYFEGLRGIATLIVVFNHYMLSFYPAVYSKSALEIHTSNGLEKIIYNSPLSIFFNGNFAVYVFLILSGIVLSINYFEKNKSTDSLTSIAIKRYFRLLPPIIFCNFLILLVLLFHLNFNYEASLITHSTWWLKAFWQFQPNIVDVVNQTFLGMFFIDIPQTYNPVLWVIPLFFLGTLLVTGTLALFGKTPKRYIIYIFLIFILIRTYFYPFIIGISLCDFFLKSKKMDFLKNKIILFFMFVIGLYFGSYPIMLSQEQLANTIYMFLPKIHLIDDFSFYHVLGASLLILSLILSTTFQRILSNRLFVFLGKISYSFYVFHIIIIGTLSCYLFLQFYQGHSYNKAFVQMFLITFPLIIVCSYLIHRFIERKGSILANKVSQFIMRK
jgi:peptidoglycan/LPS O-acetylase OafA/YrhL